MMKDNTIFESAAERIAFSEAVDFIEQGRAQLIPKDVIERYLRMGLWERDGDRLRLTDEGERQHRLALQERFTDG